jgi:hypothetical protein
VQNSNEQSENLLIALAKLSGMAVIELCNQSFKTHENSQQSSRFCSNMGQSSVVVFRMSWLIPENSQHTSALNWPTCHAWQSLNNFMLQKMCV